jgi:putative lipase involved disintegration of autophagic bodies
LNDAHQEAVACFKALSRISAKANEKAFENICHNGWHRSCRDLLEDKSRASETCSLQREIRLQSVLNTTERLIDLP